MRQVFVGSYHLGPSYVDLYLREGYGGDFFCTPEPKHCPRIKIGADYENWSDIIGVLVHELMELQFSTQRCRFEPDCGNSGTDRFIFIATHNQFSDASLYVGIYLADCLPALQKVWKVWHKKPRPRTKNP